VTWQAIGVGMDIGRQQERPDLRANGAFLKGRGSDSVPAGTRRGGGLFRAIASSMDDQQHPPPLASASELVASGAADATTTDAAASVGRRISHAMVGLKKDFYGKGPTKAKTFIHDEYVFVVMEGGLTRNDSGMRARSAHRCARQHNADGMATSDHRPTRKRTQRTDAFGPFGWERIQP